MTGALGALAGRDLASLVRIGGESRALATRAFRDRAIGSRRATTAVRVTAGVLISGHPDALRRRQEYEEWKRRRDRERAEANMVAACGLKWWQGALPPNMVAVTTPRELDLLAREAMLKGRACLINFFQDDCYACKSLHAKLKKLANDHPDVLFLKVNGSIEAMRPVFEKHGITKVPYFFCLRHGRILSRFSASLNPEKLAMLRKELVAALHATEEEAEVEEQQRPQHAEQAQAVLGLEPAVVAA